MAGRPLKRARGSTKSLVLHAASKLFIERGYSNTRIKDVADEAGVQYSEVFRVFNDKDAILSELVGKVLEYQFEVMETVLKDVTSDKLLKYAFETVLQLYVAESVEHIREMYVASYSLPRSTETIYKTITSKLEDIFAEIHPEYETKDFYELEIATAGIMRGFIFVPCDIYFTIDRKVARFLETTFKLFDVPQKRIEEAQEFVRGFDFKSIAQNLINNLFDYLKDRT